MTTPQEVLQALDRLRVFQRDDQRAVHKPLLLLLALARMGDQQPRLARYDDIEAPLKHLLAEFGPSSAIKTPTTLTGTCKAMASGKWQARPS